MLLIRNRKEWVESYYRGFNMNLVINLCVLVCLIKRYLDISYRIIVEYVLKSMIEIGIWING